jgi:hypothetical protein
MSAARCTAVWKRRPLKSCTLRTWTQWETINHVAFDQLFLLIGQLRALWIRRTTSWQPWSITKMVLRKILCTLYPFWRTQLSFHPYVCSCIWSSIRYICLVWLWRFKGWITCSSLFLRIQKSYFKNLKQYPKGSQWFMYNGVKSECQLICILGYRKLTKLNSLEMCIIHYQIC